MDAASEGAAEMSEKAADAERYVDGWGYECDEPVLCWECSGTGESWGERCGTCVGVGSLCHPTNPRVWREECAP